MCVRCATGNMHTRSACVYGALRVFFLLVACYPQRTVYALRVAILGALRVSFFLVVHGCTPNAANLSAGLLQALRQYLI
jgi:hypothetical protein